MKIKTIILDAAILLALTGCATVAPAELVTARAVHARASSGPAGKLTPTDVYEAKKALDKADNEFTKNGDTQATRDHAYIATRKSELAEVRARTEMERQKSAQAGKAGIAERDSQTRSAQAALSTTREQLTEERRQNAENSKNLESEKAARMTAEAKLAGAMKDLADVAAVKEEARGVVITLSGGVLFASGKHTLLNSAQTKLDQVAEALKMQDAGKRIVVEGHTDSMGSESTNQLLSERRSNAVREYLISKGVAADKISATGIGKARPLLDNSTAENRANNRRVEIVVAAAP